MESELSGLHILKEIVRDLAKTGNDTILDALKC